MMVKNLRPRKPSAVNGGLPEPNNRAGAHGMPGKIGGALLLSGLAHGVLLAALFFLAPYFSSSWLAFNPTQMVQLVDLPGGGGAGGGEPPKVEKPPEPKVERPSPPPPKPKAEVPKPEMTLPPPKTKERPKREEKKAEPQERQMAEKKKEVAPSVRPTPEPTRKPETPVKREPERPVTRGAGPPAAGIGPGGGLALGTGGGAASLETANFPFTYYLRQVRERIDENWVRPQEGASRVWVYFRIRRDGSVIEPQIYESSQSREADLLAVGAVKRSEPFPPLPVEFGDDSLGIYFCFGKDALCPTQRPG